MSKMVETVTKAGTIEVVTGNFKLDDTEIPSPSSIDCEYHKLARAYNDGYGIEHSIPIRLKKSVTFHYNNVSNETFKKINDYIMKKLIDNGVETVNLKTLFIGYDEPIELYVRVGSPITPNMVYGNKNKMIVSFDLHFIEPIGVKIQSS